MLYQSFNAKGLRCVISGKEFRKDPSVHTIDDLNLILEEAEKDIRAKAFNFTGMTTAIKNNKPVYLLPDLKASIVLKKANDNLRRVFKVKQTDRSKLVRTIIALIAEETPYYLIKGDIKNFYESLPRKQVLQTATNNQLLSYDTKWILDNLFSTPLIAKAEGMPRGLGVSATFSEIHMKYFDHDVRRLPGVYYYGRFVDDFIVFCFDNPDNIIERIGDLLHKAALTLNPAKTLIMHHKEPSTYQPVCFDYLGYSVTKEVKNKEPTVTISRSKINKIKTRIVASFLSYARNKDVDLLIARIQFLTSNYYLHEHRSITPIKAGIFYNYPFAKDCLVDLNALDTFLRRQIFAKNGIPAKHAQPLGHAEKDRLKRFSFVKGYVNRIECDFSDAKIKKIAECWKHE